MSIGLCSTRAEKTPRAFFSAPADINPDRHTTRPPVGLIIHLPMRAQVQHHIQKVPSEMYMSAAQDQ